MKLYKVTDRFYNGSNLYLQHTAYCYADDRADLDKYMQGVKAKNDQNDWPTHVYEIEEIDPDSVKIGILRKGATEPEWRELLD